MRRSLAFKVAGIFLGAVILCAGSMWLWLKSVEARKWAAMERRVAELRESAGPRHAERLPFGGDPMPGNAWDDYVSALGRSTGALKPGERRRATQGLDEMLGRDAPGEDLQQEVAFHRASLEEVRRGARRSTAALRPEARQAADGFLDEAASGYLAALGVCDARLMLRAGRAADAADALVDLLRFGCDLGDAGLEISSSYVHAHALAELGRILESGRLPSGSHAGLRTALEALDRSMSLMSQGLGRRLAGLGSELLEDPASGVRAVRIIDDDSFSGLDWRFGFSRRHYAADAFARLDGWLSRLAALESGPYPTHRDGLKTLQADMAASPNRIAAVVGPFVLSDWGRERRGTVARIRLLRAACGAPDLDDPFGGKLKRESGRIWSVGLDGVDDGGKGGWEEGPDIVLELKGL